MKQRRFSVSPERYEVVLKEISEGSEPEMRFYIMVAISTMIACFGLITNSTAVIIGAMLVAPLMTPIFGIALALIRSDKALFGKALKAEIAGVVAAILMGVTLGILYPALDPTPEMIARTKPQLFDLFIAVFSGLAGAYALMDEKISPALPGVAIATAIVPPLANSGLCFSLGQYAAGVGSFLLFFANFLSILLVASAAFWIFGMAGSISQLDKKTLFKRFSFPIFCFVFVTAFLTNTLMSIAKQSYINQTIVTTLEKDLLKYQDVVLDGAKYNEEDDVIYVLAEVHSSEALTPTQVDSLQNSLQQAIGQETNLIVRSKLAKEISALGSKTQLGKQQLDGSFTNQSLHPRVRDAKIADTVLRNYLAPLVGYKLDIVRTFKIGDTPIFLASINGVAAPSRKIIEKMESLLRQELDRPELRLVVSFSETSLFDSSGSIRLEFSGLTRYQGSLKKEVQESISYIETEIAGISEMFISGINYNVIDGILYIMVETSGPKTLSPEKIGMFEKMASDKAGMPVKLYAYMNTEIVVTSTGHEPYSSVFLTGMQRQLPSLKKDVQKIIEASNM